MKLGIVGLPNVGKSTLFNSLTKAGAESANYPFCTIDPNVGVVAVPDERLNVLGKMHNSGRIVPASIEFVDIVRCFEDTNIIHVEGSISPARDIETINLELIFADIEVLERRKSRVAKSVSADKIYKKELDMIVRLIAFLEEGNLAKAFTREDDDEERFFAEYNLLTAKPVIYAANVKDEDLADDGESNKYVKEVRDIAAKEGSEVFVVCAQIEQEISELDDEDKKSFLEDLGLSESGLEKLIKASYKLLGLISYITAGEMETKAWTITAGTKAPQAAGKIHTDFERGFIRAEVVSYDNLIACGSMAAAKEKGLVRSEGKEYVMNDGDIVLFRFNV